jgi:hypothetical protein
MMHRARRALFLLSWLVLHAVAFPAGAQSPPTITELQVALWPEYDDPSMLVIYRVRLDPATELPAMVELPIPASVGDPLAVAMTDSSGDLVNARYTRRVSGEWGMISVTAESLQLQIEYYGPLVIEGQLRRFTYTWPGVSNVESMSYEVQTPIGAEEMTITPTPASQTVGRDGLTYYSADLPADAGTSGSKIDVTYVKTTADLTADLLSLPPGSSDSTQGGTPDLRQFIPWALLGFGVILVAFGGAWYLRLSRESSTTGRRRRRASRPASRSDQERDMMDASPVFCHNCGTRAAANDRFCRSCGLRLRQ